MHRLEASFLRASRVNKEGVRSIELGFLGQRKELEVKNENGAVIFEEPQHLWILKLPLFRLH